jgi:hypothetical protein
MAFGRTYRPKRRAPAQAKRSSSFKIKLSGAADFEQLSTALQTAIAEMEKHGARGVQSCTLYCTPLGIAGEPMSMRDENGSVLETFEIEMQGLKPVTPAGVKRLSAPALASSFPSSRR